ncbi:uncharacterized protein BP01DRAFT_208225 [Aspergillus saccharolyticus JOP 1030-1]|uniref:GPI anchored protein n=1 Tax=Aspergillus saccharolyticus JOP 1030-1 TaxID=1450539 RepID=A0A318YZX6_9EURO|nr:hypothetical protein BP01DRAFT_208225 [Aspergillus saccharolyticus JOP 1030-1]PYH40571.1 hypothetical protein BP01DRAFT_208225 [Aspergillus saccharolyticus JOP 1030-1]
MKISAIVSSLFCLAAAQLVAAEGDTTSTSTVTTFLTRTLVHVDTVTSGASTTSAPLIPTHAVSAPLISSSAVVSSSVIPTSLVVAPSASASATSSTVFTGAGNVNAAGMSVALVAGSLALIMGAL